MQQSVDFSLGTGGFSFDQSFGAGIKWFLSSGVWNQSGYWDDNLGTIQAASTDWFLLSGTWNEDGLWDDALGVLV